MASRPLVVSTMLSIWQIYGGKGEYEDGSELKDLEGIRSKVTAELRQATNSGRLCEVLVDRRLVILRCATNELLAGG
jgi:hypothetical protein